MMVELRSEMTIKGSNEEAVNSAILSVVLSSNFIVIDNLRRFIFLILLLLCSKYIREFFKGGIYEK